MLRGDVELPGIMGTAVFKFSILKLAERDSVLKKLHLRLRRGQEMIKSRSRAHSHSGNQTIYVNLVADRKTANYLGLYGR